MTINRKVCGGTLYFKNYVLISGELFEHKSNIIINNGWNISSIYNEHRALYIASPIKWKMKLYSLKKKKRKYN